MNAPTAAAVVVLGGALLLVLGRWLQKSFVEPLQEQREAIGEIDFLLIHFAQVIANPMAEKSLGPEQITDRQAASRRLEEAAWRLAASTDAVRPYWLACGAPKKDHAREATYCLRLISHSMFAVPRWEQEAGEQNRAAAERIRELLKFRLTNPNYDLYDLKDAPASEASDWTSEGGDTVHDRGTQSEVGIDDRPRRE